MCLFSLKCSGPARKRELTPVSNVLTDPFDRFRLDSTVSPLTRVLRFPPVRGERKAPNPYIQEDYVTVANTKSTTPNSHSALVEALRSTGIDDSLIYNAIDEIRDMGGSNVFAAINTLDASITGKLDALTAEFNGKLDTKVAELNGRIDSLVNESRTNRWFLGAFIAFVAVFGFFKG